jgi:hypothetical protein
MTVLHRPTAEEKRVIRECAQHSAGFRSVEINPSTKYSLTNPARGEHMNICLVSDHPTWDDTDLADNAFQWRDFTKGFPLAEGGRAIVDFYVYNRGRNSELQTNVTAYWRDGKLVRVDGTCNGTMWREEV